MYVLATQRRDEEIVHVRRVTEAMKALCGASPVPVLIFGIGEEQTMCEDCSSELAKRTGTPTFLVMRNVNDEE